MQIKTSKCELKVKLTPPNHNN